MLKSVVLAFGTVAVFAWLAIQVLETALHPLIVALGGVVR